MTLLMSQKSCKPDMVGSLSHPLPMNLYILGDECRISEPPQGATKNQLNPIHPIQAIVNESMKHGRRKPKKRIFQNISKL